MNLVAEPRRRPEILANDRTDQREADYANLFKGETDYTLVWSR